MHGLSQVIEVLNKIMVKCLCFILIALSQISPPMVASIQTLLPTLWDFSTCFCGLSWVPKAGVPKKKKKKAIANKWII